MPAPRPNRRQRARSLYRTLLARSHDERESYFDTECGDDPELRREVQKLLRFDTPLPPDTRGDGIELDDGRIDDGDRPKYADRRLHARGGLGSIWIARDAVLKREVALKELLQSHAGNIDARRRFLREAQITGQLEHPNILPVYDLHRGNPAGELPYYSMRLLRGQTLRAAILEYRRIAAEDTPRAARRALRRLLSAFLGVCNTVAYAHSRGVVHRDLKPDNVMLGDFGEIILLDWGLAKVLDQDDAAATTGANIDLDADPLSTRFGLVMGTPAYMAPEQARGETASIDERTDVYGLGAILFEILTGEPPHRGQDTKSTLQAILHGHTRQPRQLDHKIPLPLDAICRTATARTPERRYSAASALGEDVERWLADEPVSVHRDALGVRVARWSRRHRYLVHGAVGALLAVLVATTLFAVRFGQMAERERTLRHRGMHGAAQFAAKTVAAEVELRWRTLETAAADARVTAWCADPTTLATGPAGAAPLTTWLGKQFERNLQATQAASWFVTDKHGIQLARWPYSDLTVGRDYSFRDYFHGRGVDLEPSSSDRPPPLDQAHRSIVFRSQASGRPMVAFSVPVRGEDDSVTGVLAMTVEAGRFGVLQSRIPDEQVAVLIDTRPDWLDRAGRVLHHPALIAAGGHQATNIYVPASLVARFDALRATSLQRERQAAALPLEQQLQLRLPPTDEGFDAAYVDPVGQDYSGSWLAAFEPVLIQGRQDRVGDTGWIVVVQERAPSR